MHRHACSAFERVFYTRRTANNFMRGGISPPDCAFDVRDRARLNVCLLRLFVHGRNGSFRNGNVLVLRFDGCGCGCGCGCG